MDLIMSFISIRDSAINAQSNNFIFLGTFKQPEVNIIVLLSFYYLGEFVFILFTGAASLNGI